MCYRLAVVIPVRNSARTIVACLKSVFNQTYSDIIGVWIVGTEYDDNTWEALKEYRNHPLVNIVYVNKPANWVGRDANLKRYLGCQHAIEAGADILALIDSQITGVPDWFLSAVTLLKEHSADMLGGITQRNPEDKSLASVFYDEALISEFPRFGNHFILTKDNFGQAPGLPTTANLFMRRDVFLCTKHLWPYGSTHDWEDFELIWVIAKEGGFSILCTDLVKANRMHKSKFRLAKQVAAGMGYVHFAKKHPDCGYIYKRMLFAVLFVGLMILSLIYAITTMILCGWIGIAIWMMIHGCVIILASFFSVIKAKDPRGIIFPLLIFFHILLWIIGAIYCVSSRRKTSTTVANLLLKFR